MTVPLATTTITWQSGTETEPGEGRSFTTLATAVRAHIGSPSGRDQLRPGGGREVVEAVCDCDPVAGAARFDRVVDANTGVAWDVVWVDQREGLGLDHTHAGLVRTTGAVGG